MTPILSRPVVRTRPAWVGRVLVVAAFGAAFAFLALPFLMCGPPASTPLTPVAPSVTYSGLDLAFGGTADIRLLLYGDDDAYHITTVTDHDLFGGAQPPVTGSPYGLLAVGCIGVGILAALIPTARVRAVVASGAGLGGALALLALQAADRPEVARMLVRLIGPVIQLGPDDPVPVADVSLRSGFYLAIAVLIVVGLAQVVVAVPRPPTTAGTDD